MRFLLLLLLAGCAHWRKIDASVADAHGRCEYLCDRWAQDVGGGLPAIWYEAKLDVCRCWSPLKPGEYTPTWKPRPTMVEYPAPKLQEAF